MGPRLRVTPGLVLVCCVQLLPAEARPRLHVPRTRPALVLSQARLLDVVTFIAGTQLRVAVAQECARLTFAVSDIPLQGLRCSVTLTTPSLFVSLGIWTWGIWPTVQALQGAILPCGPVSPSSARA